MFKVGDKVSIMSFEVADSINPNTHDNGFKGWGHRVKIQWIKSTYCQVVSLNTGDVWCISTAVLANQYKNMKEKRALGLAK